MLIDLIPPQLAGLAALLTSAWTRAGAMVTDWPRPEILAAFAAGAAAAFCGARLLLLAAVALGGAQMMTEFGLLPVAPTWLLPACIALALLGILQGIVTAVAGQETFGNLLLMALALAGAGAALALWRLPAAVIARLLRRSRRP